MRIRCGQCRELYRWTLAGCPRCLRPNANSPVIIVLKVLAVGALCVAIIAAVRLLATTEGAIGVREEDRYAAHVFPAPVPGPPRTLTFSR